MSDKISKYAGYVNKDDSSEDVNKEASNDKDSNSDVISEDTSSETIYGQHEEDLAEAEQAQDKKREEAEELKEQALRAKRTSSGIRIFAGIYLIYICVSAFSDHFNGVTEGLTWYFAVIYVIFGIVGVYLIINSLKTQRDIKKELEEDNNDDTKNS